jgi:NAD-dependent dihydropyrimidine dehydrogenase PreA subunit
MLLRVDDSLCTGCGVCVDTCPTDALRLDREANVATVDPALCNGCLFCLDACPNGAIQEVESSELIPMVEGEIVERPVTRVPVARFPQTLERSSRLAALAGTALSLAGRWFLPRAANALLDALARRLPGGSTPSSRLLSLGGGNQPFRGTERGGTRSRSRQRRRQGW